ncbi:endonuclease/exonuclease/phosphatase family protein [Carboxylicivirga sediminis]|uniref:Endonuclease/exonuclease/phosphatase family protein n=1 Tax=Carboxylicivirga sediminis TaxID=2006564 RepID=A0A941F6T6_9BACT|nr:endonuclease/exonuclease/phosphatase family protein [Carboxylicivirga sediminis]MBR8537622.1 endonuclease/exonuclease/phosphatase family protein [Carboxylicivirga sediminis]
MHLKLPTPKRKYRQLLVGAMLLLSLLPTLLTSCQPIKEKELKVLQFNIWQEGTVVPNGYTAILDEIIRLDADLIALSEVRNYNNQSLAERLVRDLKERGHTFYSETSYDSGILSRYPIISQKMLFPAVDDHGSVTKAIINMDGIEVALYSAHLDYRNCSLYLPRGYDGSTWEKLDSIITDTEIIASDNLQSQRDEAIQAVIADARIEHEKGRLTLLGGDFNEPSHLDWTETTKDLFDHNGVVMEWHNTKRLEQAGFIDVYRQMYPNPVSHPGFTFPADNPLVDIKKLAWAPEADDRDRIDFIFYQPHPHLQLIDAAIVGPRGSIVRNERVQEQSSDSIIPPATIWPTDHKAILATFKLSSK